MTMIAESCRVLRADGLRAAIGYIVRVLAGTLLFIFVAPAAFAQVQNGEFVGTVTDPTGSVISGAMVEITHIGMNYTVTLHTDGAGNYRVSQMPIGAYRLDATSAGFQHMRRTGVTLNAGVVARIDFRMEISTGYELVTVEADAPLVNVDDARPKVTVHGRQVASLPLYGRNVFELIQVTPGAVDVEGVSFESGEQTSFNGLRPTLNGFVLNGSSNKGLSGGAITTPNPEIVAEFQVLTLNNSAEYGNSAGAITNMVTKSGGNDFHGSVYWFHRDESFDANDFFRNQFGSDKAPLEFNQYGGHVTGRLVPDKLFFTASMQNSDFITVLGSGTALVESQEWRDAIIAANAGSPDSVAAFLYQNYAPATEGTPFFTVQEFIASGLNFNGFWRPSHYLCDSNLSRLANIFGVSLRDPNEPLALAQDFAGLLGVTAVDESELLSGGCTVLPQQAGQIPRNLNMINRVLMERTVKIQGNLQDGQDWSTRLDWVSSNDRVFGEIYWQQAGTPTIFFGGAAARGFATPLEFLTPNLQIGWTHTISARLSNELRAGAVRDSVRFGAVDPGVPLIGLEDFTAGFGSVTGPDKFEDTIYTISETLNAISGSNTVRAGAQLRLNQRTDEINSGRPLYVFQDQLFLAVDAPFFQSAGVNPNFLSSAPAVLTTNLRQWSNQELGLFIQDDWKVSRRLTLNLGVRYYVFTQLQEEQDLATTFVLGPGESIPAGPIFLDGILNASIPRGQPGCDTAEQMAQAFLAGVCGPGGFAFTEPLGAGTRSSFAPRVGIAWDVLGNGKLALRGGYGISYEGLLYDAFAATRWNPPSHADGAALNWQFPLFGVDHNIIYGPQDGSAVRIDGVNNNIGAGEGVTATGNIMGWDPENLLFMGFTGIVLEEAHDDPWVENWHVGLQAELPAGMMVEANYIGTRGNKLVRQEDVNRMPGMMLPNGMTANVQGRTITGLGRVLLNPNFAGLAVWENNGRSWYDALQVSLRRRMSRGLLFNLQYQWSHAIDIASGWDAVTTTANGFAAGDAYALDPTQPELDRGNSTFDIRERLVFNFVYDLPWRTGQRGALGRLIGGWQWNGILAMQTGAHWTPYTSRPASGGCFDPNDYATCFNSGGDFNLDGLRNDRFDVGPGGPTFNATRDMWANGWYRSADFPFDPFLEGLNPFFARPCVACNGNFPRNSFEGPGQFNLDLSLFKNTRIGEGGTLQIRIEAFNALNRTNFTLPSNGGNNARSFFFGRAGSTLNPRQIQFGIKLLL